MSIRNFIVALITHSAILLAMYVALWALFCMFLMLPIVGWVISIGIGYIQLNFQYVVVLYFLLVIGHHIRREANVRTKARGTINANPNYI